MIRISKQRGFTLLQALAAAILLGIAAQLLFSWLNSEQTAHALRCQNDILNMQRYEHQWLASGEPGKRDTGLCNQLNSRVDQYNKTCGKDFGMMEPVDCTK